MLIFPQTTYNTKKNKKTLHSNQNNIHLRSKIIHKIYLRPNHEKLFFPQNQTEEETGRSNLSSLNLDAAPLFPASGPVWTRGDGWPNPDWSLLQRGEQHTPTRELFSRDGPFFFFSVFGSWRRKIMTLKESSCLYGSLGIDWDDWQWKRWLLSCSFFYMLFLCGIRISMNNLLMEQFCTKYWCMLGIYFERKSGKHSFVRFN